VLRGRPGHAVHSAIPRPLDFPVWREKGAAFEFLVRARAAKGPRRRAQNAAAEGLDGRGQGGRGIVPDGPVLPPDGR